MILLEKKLLKSISIGDKETSLNTYNELYNLYLKTNIGFGCLRTLKSHLICLNIIVIHNMSCCNYICKKKLISQRMHFIEEIERQRSIENLYILGKEIVISALYMRKEKFTKTTSPIINQALVYIDNNLDGNLTLQKVADEIHVNKNYLSLLFSKHMGHSFSEYVKRVKIDRAKKLLQDNSLSLLDIALECGFNSQSYFCYVFRKLENMSPKQYREEYNK